MRSDNAVPDVQVLERFLLGQLSRDEAELIERYLEQHPDIASTLAELVKDDTLVGSLRASGGQAAADPPELAGLMDKLSQLRSPGDEATVGLPNGASGDNEALAGLAPPQAADEIGRLGGYRVLKVLGAGGMGMVYHAEDVHLQRPIALKVMKASVAQNASARERFLREARAAAKLHSDHVVTIHQVGEDKQIVFLAMEFLEGMALDDWLKKGRTPSLTQAARIGRQIALGLADAHACGLIHRDIKPGNIWLDSRHQGRAKLLDFGLARGNAEEIHLTQSGAIVGTPAYMAPEQARGEHVDHRVDLFSLGVVLYRLTTGRLPFRGDNTMSVLTSLAMDTPTAPREINPNIPPRMAALIERLLSKDREQRPATARAVADELAAIEREAAQPAREERTVEVVRAASVSEPVCSPARSRSRLGKYIAAASLLLVLGCVAAAVVIIIRDPQGNKIAEINAPKGSKVEIVDDAAGAGLPRPQPKDDVRIAAAPLAPSLPGEPLSLIALVRQPAKLPGVRSWTIARRDVGIPASVAYRPDGERLAVGAHDGPIHIWEPRTGRLVQVLLGRKTVLSLAWSPDGRVLAAGSFGERVIRLWEAESGRLLRVLEAPAEAIHVLSWSPDGQRLRAYASQPWDCFTWNTADGKLLRKVGIPPGNFPVFSPDGKRLAETGVVPDTVCIYDAQTGEERRRLTGHKGATAPLDWSPDGKRLACAAADGLHVWDTDTGKECFSHKEVGSCGMVRWSPDGRSLAWSLPGNSGVAVMEATAEAQPRRLEDPGASYLAWSPDGKSIARINGWPWVRLYDAAAGKRLRTLSEGGGGTFSAFAPSPDGQTLAVAEGTETILSSMDTGQVLHRLEDTSGPLAWSPDGKRLATRGGKGLALWDATGQLRHTMVAHPPGADWLAFAPDGKRLASASNREKHVLLWDADKGERLRELGPFDGPAQSLSWSPDGRLLAFNVPNAGWHLWDVEKNNLANEPKQWIADSFLFAPDGRNALARLDYNDVYRLRELATGKEHGQLPYVRLWPPAWSPDGRLLAVVVGATVELWRGDLRRRVRTLKPMPFVEQVAFSADGKLVVGRGGKRLHVWEADTGRLRGIQLLGEHNNGLTLTPDGQYRGNEQVERGIVMVVQKDDGTQEVLEPADFEQKYGFKNQPDKVHLLQPLPPSLYPLPGMPMGPRALVREPAELPDVNSWTIETVNARGTVKAVAYSPDGKLLATGGDDGTIRIWDTTSGKFVRMLVGDPVASLSWSRDGKILAVGSGHNNGETTLWETETGRLLRRIPFGALAAWSPREQTLALRVGETVQLWDATTERFIRSHRFSGYGGAPAWSPDDKTLAVGLSDKTVRLWDTGTDKETHKLDGHAGVVVAVAWSPDGKRLVSAARGERAFHVWDAANGKRLGRFAMDNVWDMEAVAAWSPDGKAVAFGFNHAQGPNGLFDPATGQSLRSLDAGGYVTALSISPNGKQVATAGGDGVRLCDAASGKRTHVLEEGNVERQIASLAWSPDSRSLALRGKEGGSIQIVEAATGRQQPIVASDGWQMAARSPDGRIKAIPQGKAVQLDDANGTPLGVLLPFDVFGQLAVTSDGRYRGNARVERAIRMVVQKRDGTSETLTVGEFEQKYGFKNDPATVRLTAK